MSSLVISGDTSGAVTLNVPAVAGTNTVTIPAATGTVMVVGNIPAFNAGCTTLSDTTVAQNALVTFNTVSGTNGINRGSCYNTSTNLFTAPVTGLYLFGFSVYYTGGGGAYTQAMQAGLYKNGAFMTLTSTDAIGTSVAIPNNTGGFIMFTTTALIPMNANDTMGVAARNGAGIRIYQGHNNFFGYLVG
jgi:hypothetical protein